MFVFPNRVVFWSTLVVVTLAVASQSASGDERIAVLEFELNDLTLDPANTQERERTSAIAPALRAELSAIGGFTIIPVSKEEQSQADRAFGYLFDRPQSAADLGASLGADWIAVGRLHKPSFLFAYLQSRLVHVQSGQLRGDLVVEIKGHGADLIERGARQLARQIDEAIAEIGR